jgi:hypothetical protein
MGAAPVGSPCQVAGGLLRHQVTGSVNEHSSPVHPEDDYYIQSRESGIILQ